MLSGTEPVIIHVGGFAPLITEQLPQKPRVEPLVNSDVFVFPFEMERKRGIICELQI
jgi:hypothetical protein